MNEEIFVKIILAIITIIGGLISAYVIPYLRTKIGADQLDKVNYYIGVAVRCADQIFTEEQWKEKKEYVLDYAMRIVNEKLHINLTQEDVDIIIEGLVNEIHKNDLHKGV